jgi:hypothetical protein
MNMATEIFNGFLRLGNFPLDENSIFSTYVNAETYAKENETAYAGQIVTVVTESIVSVYYLTYPFTQGYTGNFELRSVGSGSIESVNSVTPVDNNITIYGTNISISSSDATTIAQSLARIEGLTANETTITSTKNISAPGFTISGSVVNDTDAVNKSFMETRIDSMRRGITYSVRYTMNNTGRIAAPADFDIPVGSTITKIKVFIDQAYQSSMTVKLGEQTLIAPEDIFEGTIGVYLSEPNILVASTETVSVQLTGSSATGSGSVYLEYFTNTYN